MKLIFGFTSVDDFWNIKPKNHGFFPNLIPFDL